MEKRKKIVVLAGGYSDERDVSKVSSLEISKSLKESGFNVEVLDPADFGSFCELVKKIKIMNPYIVFLGLHGAAGEDGRIQSLLSLENIPFTGSEFRASAIAIDKYISATLVSAQKIKIPQTLFYKKHEKIEKNEIIKEIGFPLVVKPNDSGSSVGISIVIKKEDLSAAIDYAYQFGDSIIVQKYIEGRELTVTVLGNKALPVVEIKPKNGWYDYRNKYTRGNTIYEVPAALSKNHSNIVKKYAETIYRLFGCKAYARIDFRFDGNDFYFLEVNTLPGMTPLSLTPMAAKEAGIDFSELLLKIIDYSLKNSN